MTEEILKAAAKEHGHECPGLALGLRVSDIVANSNLVQNPGY